MLILSDFGILYLVELEKFGFDKLQNLRKIKKQILKHSTECPFCEMLQESIFVPKDYFVELRTVKLSVL